MSEAPLTMGRLKKIIAAVEAQGLPETTIVTLVSSEHGAHALEALTAGPDLYYLDPETSHGALCEDPAPAGAVPTLALWPQG